MFIPLLLYIFDWFYCWCLRTLKHSSTLKEQYVFKNIVTITTNNSIAFSTSSYGLYKNEIKLSRCIQLLVVMVTARGAWRGAAAGSISLSLRTKQSSRPLARNMSFHIMVSHRENFNRLVYHIYCTCLLASLAKQRPHKQYVGPM